MIQVKSTSKSGAILITEHYTEPLAALEVAVRKRAGHTNIETITAAEHPQDYTETAVQKGIKNKAQWAHSQKGHNAAIMSGGSL